jgi:hypothetical protein
MDPVLDAGMGRVPRPVLFQRASEYIRRAADDTDSLARANKACGYREVWTSCLHHD